jgi:type I restriction enzyme M protein
MSEIVAEHLKDKKQIKIYDPTSGSGSLLINIGRAASKYITGDGKIDYYAQELKENTYNLTRMNLVMRGIKPANINVRNGDTLEDDWPFFEENKKDSTYELVRVDAVVSNPPYSQKWDPKDKEFDPRFKNYGVAPKTKADYAFLLHDLYHLNDDGIMTIVLPHGVLFRGGEEATIRENLVEKNNIDTIIGLPENIFFGTGIPTIIMVLKRNRPTTDILIIDASKGFEKAGKNNRLRDCDIKRIVDTVKNRVSVDKYSAVVSKNTIRENGYNLNIPRYVDSSDEPEKWDIGATMIGGIPNAEIDELQEYWDTFPGLRESIFKPMSEGYSTPAVEQIGKYVQNFGSVVSYKNAFSSAFNGFYQTLYDELIDGVLDVQIEQEKEKLASDIFSRVDPIPLIDRYAAYQSFAGHWNVISGDIEMLQTEGFEVITQVDPNMVIKKNNKEDDEITEVQDGWKGHILPFELVQTELLPDAVREIDSLERRLAEIGEEYTEIIDSFDEDEKQGSYINDNNDAFVTKELKAAVDDALKEVTSAEIQTLSDYLAITSKKDKIAYIEENKAADWAAMTSNADGTYKKTVINNRIKELKQQYIFPAGSFESKIIAALQLTEEETAKKRELKLKKEELQIKTKEVVEGLSEDEALKIVELKWLNPLYNDLIKLPDIVINDFIAKLYSLLKKYAKPLSDIEDQTRETEMQLSTMIGELNANDQDMQGINEFIKLIGGNTR